MYGIYAYQRICFTKEIYKSESQFFFHCSSETKVVTDCSLVDWLIFKSLRYGTGNK